MAPKAPDPDEEDGLPESSDDEERPPVRVPPVKNLPRGGEDASAPLLPPAAAPSDSKPMLSPRDKFRNKSKSTTPREHDVASDAKAAASEFASGVGSELSGARLPSKEEREGAASSVKAQFSEAKEAWANSFKDMLNEAPPIDKLPDAQRMESYIDNLAAQAEGKAPAGVVGALKPCVLMTIKVFMMCEPWSKFVVKWAQVFWDLLPKNVAMMVFGAALCYFGGSYVASIAAVEAFRTMGFERAKAEITRLTESVKLVQEESLKDDEEDLDGDGVADVEQISKPELVRRKMFLTMRTIDEPELIQAAIGSIWAAILAVLATMRIQFAASTAIGLGIVDMIKFPILRIASGPLLAVLGTDLKHWVTPAIEMTLTLIVVVIAFYFISLIAAVYAAVRGGRIFALGLFGLLVEQASKGVVICPGIVGTNWDPNESVLDEIVGYVIAAQGLMFQMSQGYVLTFPWNVLLLPLTIVDLLVKWLTGAYYI